MLYNTKTPMSLGKWSLPMGIMASLWLYGTSCLFLFPQYGPLTLETNNWLIVIVAFCFVCGAVYWTVGGGSTSFTGPKRHDLAFKEEPQTTSEGDTSQSLMDANHAQI